MAEGARLEVSPRAVEPRQIDTAAAWFIYTRGEGGYYDHCVRMVWTPTGIRMSIVSGERMESMKEGVDKAAVGAGLGGGDDGVYLSTDGESWTFFGGDYWEDGRG